MTFRSIDSGRIPVSVVIPAYNSARQIGDVLLKSLRVVSRESIVVVDDGSCDETAAVVDSFNVFLLRHTRNLGKGEALKSGIGYALKRSAKGIVTLDGDGQHDPSEIQEMIAIMDRENADLVIGCRKFQYGIMPADRILSNRISSWMISRCIKQPVPDSQCGFRLFRTEKLKNLEIDAKRFEVETEMLLRAAGKGWVIRFCPIQTLYNNSPSHIRRGRDTWDFLRTLIAFRVGKMDNAHGS
ncbi:MAG TPA: glycosyltransferase family 2 protein [bacterium]|nr:glycosyltransferase family 2 protein [bacterium]